MIHCICIAISAGLSDTDPDCKVHGTNMGPTWFLSSPDGPNIDSMNLPRQELQGINMIASQYRTQLRMHYTDNGPGSKVHWASMGPIWGQHDPCGPHFRPMNFVIWGLPGVHGTVYPKKYAHGFVVLCFVVVMQLFIMNSHEVFIHIHQGCFAGTGAIVRLPQCQWSKPDGFGKISQCITTTKHSKAKTVCMFLGIYCKLRQMCERHELREYFTLMVKWHKYHTHIVQSSTLPLTYVSVIFKL